MGAAEQQPKVGLRPILRSAARSCFVQGLGAAVGPLLASVALMVGPSATFLWYLAAVYLLVAAYAVYRISGWAPVEVQSPYEPIASGATPTILSVTGVDHFHRAVELAAWRTVGWPAYARRLAAIVYDSSRHPERRALVQADALRADPHAVAATRRAAMRAIPQHPVDLGCPVLLVVGTRDPGAPPGDLTRLRSRLVDHQLAVIEGAGRFVGLDVPHELDQVIIDHVGRADEITSTDSPTPPGPASTETEP